MTTLVLRGDTVVPEGGVVLNSLPTDTEVLGSLVAWNPLRRGSTTIRCDSPVDGSLVIFGVRRTSRLQGSAYLGKALQLRTLAVTGGTLAEVQQNYTEEYIYCEFTPSATDGSNTVVIDVLFGGAGISI